MSFVVNPSGNAQIQTVKWTGVGGYYSYFASAASTTPTNTPPSPGNLTFLAPQPLTPANQNAIGFLVDPRVSSYSVTAQVTYVGFAQSVSVSCNFSVVRPTASLSVISTAPANQAIRGGQGGFQFVGTGTYPNDAGIRFQMTTSIPAGGFGGSFMVLQTVSPARSYTDAQGNNHTFQLDNEVPAYNSPNYQLGYTYPNVQVDLDQFTGTVGAQLQQYFPADNAVDNYTDSNGNQLYQWSQSPTAAAISLTTADPVSAGFPDGAQSQTVDSELFNTYLMYLPSGGGAWTAVSKVQWTWSVSATAANGWALAGQQVTGSNVGVMDPWPQWVGLISVAAAKGNMGFN